MGLCSKIEVDAQGVKSLKPLYSEATREVPTSYFEVPPSNSPFSPLSLPLPPKQEYVWRAYIGRLPIVFLKMLGAMIDHNVFCVVNKFTLAGTLVGESIGSLPLFLLAEPSPPLLRISSLPAQLEGGVGPLVRWGRVGAAPD